MRCSINAADPLLFGPGILEEYALCRDRLGLDDDMLAHVARCSLEASGAPEELVSSAVASVDAWLAAEPETPRENGHPRGAEVTPASRSAQALR